MKNIGYSKTGERGKEGGRRLHFCRRSIKIEIPHFSGGKTASDGSYDWPFRSGILAERPLISGDNAGWKNRAPRCCVWRTSLIKGYLCALKVRTTACGAVENETQTAHSHHFTCERIGKSERTSLFSFWNS